MRYAVEVKEGETWRRIEGKTLGAKSDAEAQQQAQRRFPHREVRVFPYRRHD